MEPLTAGLLIIGIIIGLLIVAIKKLHKFSKNLELLKNQHFSKRYRFAFISVTIIFMLGVLMLSFAKKHMLLHHELQVAILIFLFGILWFMALITFLLGFHKIRSQLLIPGTLACITIIGTFVYFIIFKPKDNGNLMYMALTISIIFIIKGILGPIAMASSLSIAAYGIIIDDSNHLFIFKDIVFHIIGKHNLVAEYIISMFIVMGTIANTLTIDYSISSLAETEP